MPLGVKRVADLWQIVPVSRIVLTIGLIGTGPCYWWIDTVRR